MGGAFFVLLLFTCLILHLALSFSYPLCTDSTAPFTQTPPLSFCPYNGTVCCDSKQDLSLKKQFQAMNISDSACASLVKSVVCAKCNPYSAELFQSNPTPRTVPILCNSSSTSSASRAIQQTSNSFCTQLWDTCQNVSIMNSPFAVSLQGTGQSATSNFTKLTDFWQSKSDFCNSYGGDSTSDTVCFDGGETKLNNTDIITPPNGMCIEKIGNGSYLDMTPHPDGSARAFFSNQEGKIWLATIPKDGSGETLGLDLTSPFLDLTDEVHYDTEFGMMGIAFHPNFAQNGRFFASFNCDKSKWPGCAGRCACNSDVDCDPSKLGNDNGAPPCQFQSVVAEFTANGSASQPSEATSAKPVEVKRILTIGLPYTSHHGGQILFGPKDGYLYFMMGDGGGSGDPYNFAQNKKSLLGKILRLDVDTNPSAAEITKQDLWGNYSIPKDNPYTEDKNLQPEIWALGLRNPWRCSFDSARPDYFMCADVGQDTYEEVDIITKNGNYGWRVFEGPDLFSPTQTPGGNTSLNSIRPIPPVMGYDHSEVNKNEGSASITGGFFYRATTDPCLNGRYLYADLYAKALWAGIETPTNSGNFTTDKIPFTCASDSPIKCSTVPGSSDISLGYIFSFGEDNNKDIYLLASSGVYRVVRPSRCSYTCSKESATPGSSPGPNSSPSNGSKLGAYKSILFVGLFILPLLLSLF